MIFNLFILTSTSCHRFAYFPISSNLKHTFLNQSNCGDIYQAETDKEWNIHGTAEELHKILFTTSAGR